jgi:ABC-type amino acid transport substrate-binding protein
LKRVAAALVLGCLGLLAWDMTRSADSRTVVVGIEDFDYLPVIGVSRGQATGFAREVFELFGKRYDYAIQYRALPVPELYKAFLVDQSIDLKFPDNPTWMLPQRKGHKISYSNGLVDFVDGVLVKPQRLGGRLEALHRLGTMRGFDVGSYEERVSGGALRLVPADDLGDLLQQGVSGQADGVFLNVAIASARLKEMGKPGALVYDPDLPHNASSYLVSSVKRADLVRQFNAFLLKDKAAIAALKRKYDIEDVQGGAAALSATRAALPALPNSNNQQPLLTLCRDEQAPYAVGNGEWITDGSDFRLTRDVLNEAGLRLRVLQLPWARCQREAAAGHLDGMLPSYQVPERNSEFVFSEPMFAQETAFFYLRQQFPSGLEWSSFDELRGNRVGMLLGGTVEPAMEKTLAGGGLLERASSAESLIKMLQHQRLDLVALDRQAGLYQVAHLGLDKDIRVSTQSIVRRNAVLALSKKSRMAQLLPRINQAIVRLNAAGRLPPGKS